ncbi:hypothetical protein TA3x_000913 [Tundrisphaera sp. TA3]|uniref:hypothetical protein n=1 Tax=Tundrisphaera sp. TA3 TaxID=3435775 RepID=UPI003EBA7F4D
MIPFIASALLGPWTYAGFLDEPPAPAPAPAPIIVPDRPGADPSGSDEADDTPSGPPEGPAAPAPEVKPTPAPPAPAPPAMHRLADAWGQTWEHPDPSFLRGWVEARNRGGVPNPYRRIP